MVTLPLPELHALLVPASATVAVCVGERVRVSEGVGDREGERVPESVGEGLAVGVAAAAEGVRASEPDTLGQPLEVKLTVPLALRVAPLAVATGLVMDWEKVAVGQEVGLLLGKALAVEEVLGVALLLPPWGVSERVRVGVREGEKEAEGVAPLELDSVEVEERQAVGDGE